MSQTPILTTESTNYTLGGADRMNVVSDDSKRMLCESMSDLVPGTL